MRYTRLIPIAGALALFASQAAPAQDGAHPGGPAHPAAWRSAVLSAVEQAPQSAAALIARGEYYLWLGSAAYAEDDARAALAFDWDNADTWDLLSRALEQKGMLPDALAALQKAAQSAPSTAALHARLGGLELRCGDEAAAEAEFAAAQGASADAATLAQIASQYARGAEPDAARRCITRALDFQTSDPELALLAQAAESAGLTELALQCRARLQSASLTEPDAPSAALAAPDDPLAQLALARHWLAAADAREALAAAAAALQLAPELASAHDVRAQAQSLLGDAETSFTELQAAIDLDATPARYLALVEARLATGDKAGADKAFAAMLGEFPTHPKALRANADRLYGAGSFEAAAQTYERAARSSPRDPELLNMSANCYYKLGEYKEAGAIYKRSLALRFDAEVAANCARTQGKLDGEDAALRAFSAFIAEHPGEAALFAARADMLFGLDRAEDALRDFEEALRLNPADAASANGAGLCLLALGRDAEALARFSTAASTQPDADYCANAAHTAASLKRWDVAEAHARAGLALQPANGDLQMLLADALVAEGRKSEALDALILAAQSADSSTPGIRAAQLAAELSDAARERTTWAASLARFPSDFELRKAYALRLQTTDSGDELLAHVEASRKALGPQYARLLDALASAWLAGRDAPAAEAFFRQLIVADARDADAYAQLALVLAAQQRFDEGLDTIKRGLNDAGGSYLGRYLECYLTAMTAGGDSALPLARELVRAPEAEPNGWLLLLRLLEEQGIYGEQVETATTARGKFPQDGRILQYLARGMSFTGDSAAAVDALTAPGAETLDCPQRDEILGGAYLELGNWTRASAHLSQAAQRNPRSAELHAALGQALLELGQEPQALYALDTAIELNPDLPGAHVWRGMLDLQRGNAEAAAAEFDLVRKSPLSGRDDLAWAALGLARLANLNGDAARAKLHLGEAQAFGYNSDAFYAACDELEAALAN